MKKKIIDWDVHHGNEL